MKARITQEQRNWSDKLESVRKDVECFFSRIKSRWRILKLPLQFHTRETIDEISSPDMFHAWDGLDQLEGDGDWAGGSETHGLNACDPDLDFCQVGMVDKFPAPGLSSSWDLPVVSAVALIYPTALTLALFQHKLKYIPSCLQFFHRVHIVLREDAQEVRQMLRMLLLVPQTCKIY
ncbi:unnamed protein product [Discosporangium mesarthrocarpum]